MSLLGVLLVVSGVLARENKLAWMEKKSATSPVISLTSSTFRAYINGGPRLYYTLVVFTSHSADRPCPPCEKVSALVEPIAESFHESRLQETPETPLFFAEVDSQLNYEIFSALDVESVPIIVLVPPTTSKKTKELSTFLTRLERQYHFKFMRELEAADIYKFLKDRTALEPHIVQRFAIPWKKILLGAGSMSVILYLRGKWIWERRGAVWMYTFAVLAFYLFNVTGGQYNRIRETPWNMGTRGWIMPQSRGQCQVEGIVVGACYLGASLMIIFALYSQTPFDDTDKKPGLIRRLLKAIPAGIPMTAFAFMSFCIVHIYTQKSAGYRHGRLGFFG